MTFNSGDANEFQGIYDLIMFAGVGGPITVIGGFIGYYVGFEANKGRVVFSTVQIRGGLLFCSHFRVLLLQAGQWLVKRLIHRD